MIFSFFRRIEILLKNQVPSRLTFPNPTMLLSPSSLSPSLSPVLNKNLTNTCLGNFARCEATNVYLLIDHRDAMKKTYKYLDFELGWWLLLQDRDHHAHLPGPRDRSPPAHGQGWRTFSNLAFQRRFFIIFDEISHQNHNFCLFFFQ